MGNVYLTPIITGASCNSGMSCDQAKIALSKASKCADARKLYISLGCDSVGRGYGVRGRKTPEDKANNDKRRHEDQHDSAKNAVKKCKSIVARNCKDCRGAI